MCNSYESEHCASCLNKENGCKKTCESYKLHQKAYNEALKIYNNKKLGIPRGECRDCTKRSIMCHSTCWSYILVMEYNHICKEEAKKKKLATGFNHLVGVPGKIRG